MPSLSALLPDVQSRSAFRVVAVQTTVGTILMLVIFLVSKQTVSELGQAAVRIFSFYSIIDCVRAMLRREHAWGASLTCWDQAAAYYLLVMFVNVLFDAFA